MRTLDWSRRLEKDRGVNMEEGDRSCCCCCCCRREGGAGHGAGQGAGREAGRFTSLGKKTRLHRWARLVAALMLLLLVSAALALLLVCESRCHQSRDGQPMKQADSHSSGTPNKQQQMAELKRPSAMLTAPLDGTTEGDYLEWESEKGNAHCRGGFNYSGGSLLVPRAGVYRVFLQVTYEQVTTCSDELRLSTSVFSITDSYDDDVPLLSSVETVDCSLGQWSKSLYTAGSFPLEAGSRLRVTSSHRELIVNREDLLFFGAELLTQCCDASEGTEP